MPLYEFSCRRCGCRFESLVRLGEEKNVRCRSCQSEDVEKLLSSFGIGGGRSRLTTSSSSCGTCTSKSCSTCR
ncbi:MAG: zinc ribbon domain-containing protein [Candidatus Aminicenantes bacterium]|nr:zinc ribbon domain-containing protein [Candidatus Aminicenantes bacterium]